MFAFLDKLLGKKAINNIFIRNNADIRRLAMTINFQTVDVGTAKGQYEAYVRTAIVSTVIDRICKLAVNNVMYIENENDENVNTPTAREAYKLLNRPNSYQNNSSFIESLLINYFVFGEAFILPIKFEGSNIVRGFSILENNQCEVLMDYSGYPNLTTGNYIGTFKYYRPNGTYIDLTSRKDEIIHIVDIEDKEYPSRGLSRFISLAEHVNKYLICANASRDLLENYGAIGMWVNEGKDGIGTTIITEPEKEEIQGALNEHGITSGKKKHYITSQNLRFEKISADLQNLQLNDVTIDSVRTICDAFGYPIDLLSIEKGASLQASGGRESEAKRQLVSGTIEPVMQKVAEGLGKVILPESEHISFYYDHLPFMQTSEKEKAELNKLYIEIYGKLRAENTISEQEYKEKLINLEIL